MQNTAVTIVIVTYNSQRTIRRCLDKLLDTLRSGDEVVLVDNASHDQTVDVVRRYIRHDLRLALITNSTNTGYSAAANQGACAGKNPLVIFLNPDAIVTPQWIERLAYHLDSPNAAAVGPLSDCVAGMQHLSLYLSLDQLASADVNNITDQLYEQFAGQSVKTKLLIGFCMMIKRDVFEALGGMDEKLFLGNDDLDLSWRLRRSGYDLVIAKDTLVLHEGQASFATESKSFTDRLVQESTDYLAYKLLEHYGENGVPSAQELWAVEWFKPTCQFDQYKPMTSMIMLTFNQLAYTKLCIESIFKNTRVPFELIVIDNGSTDGSLEFLHTIDREGSACTRIHIISNEQNVGFAQGCNQGIAQARGNYLLLINNDIVVTHGWLPRMIRAIECKPQIGLAGPVTNCISGPQLVEDVRYDTRTLQGLQRFAEITADRNSGRTTNNWRLAGYCLMIKRQVVEAIGGLDPRYKIGNFEDDDYCVRAHLAGFEALIVNDCFVHHFGSQTFLGNRIDINSQLEQNWERFKQKWGIDPQTVYQETYHIPLPREGFDPSRHYIRIDTQSSKPLPFDAPLSTRQPIQAGIPSGETERKPLTNTHIQWHQTKPPTGGQSMTIIDGVFEGVLKYMASQHKAEAAWILARLVESDPNHGRAHHELGLLSYELGDHDNAQQHLLKAVELDSENARYLKDLGDFHHVVNEDAQTAQHYYEQAIALDPEDPDLLITAAHFYTVQKAFEKAAVFYRKVLDIDPDNHQAHSCLDKVVKQNAVQNPEIRGRQLYAQAQNKFNTGDAVGAMTDLKQLLDLCPEHALAHNDIGVLLYEQGEKSSALEHYRTAVRLAPENIIFLKNMADFHWVEEQDAKTALECYIRVLKQCPTDMETLLNCGQICMSLGQYDDARDFTVQALELEPDNESAHGLMQKIEDASQGPADPPDRETLYGNAQAKAAAGDINGAIADLSQLITQYPEDASAYNDLGVLYYESGNRKKSLSCYRQAVDLAPGETTYLKNLADFYLMEQGRAEEAMELYIRVLENNPLDTDSLFASGVVCAKLEKAEDARTFYQRVLDIEPNHEAAMQAMAQLDKVRRTGDHLSIVADKSAAPQEATG